MAKKKVLSYEQKMINALNKLPNPLHDNRHNIDIYFVNDRARSNQSRFEHIIAYNHGLIPSDIERIARYINTSRLKKDPNRKCTYNLFVKRNSFNNEFIKISINFENKSDRCAIVKTIFITVVNKW